MKIEQKINKYLTLRQEDEQTWVFVGEKRIEQCTLILMNLPMEEIEKLGMINTIDEMIEYSKRHDYLKQPNMSLEDRLWAHSSAIQAWVESKYDTRLLDMRLAFPILKELTKAGEQIARERFRDEIFKRFSSGYPSVVQYLIREGYLEFLTQEEIETLLQETDTNQIKSLDLSEMGLKKFPIYVLKFKFLKSLDLEYNWLRKLPPEIKSLKNLKWITFLDNCLKELPNEITELINLEHLDLRNNQLIKLPNSIGKLINLKTLRLGGFPRRFGSSKKNFRIGNLLSNIPESLEDLQNLESISLSNNKFSEIPNPIYSLKNLTYLSFSNNTITKISQKLENLNHIKAISVSHNNLKFIPEFISEFQELETLNMGYNKLNKIPDSIGNLFQLRNLNLENNKLKSIPESLVNCQELELIDLSYNPIKEIPIGLFKLPKLKDLHIPYEPTKLPESFLKRFTKSINSKEDIWYFKF